MNEALTFLLQTLGLGLLTGFLLGYLFKKVTKVLIFLAGLVIVVVFVFGHNEILEIDWLSTKDRFHGLFDEYFDQYSDRLKNFLRNAPFLIGLIVGGLFGLVKG